MINMPRKKNEASREEFLHGWLPLSATPVTSHMKKIKQPFKYQGNNVVQTWTTRPMVLCSCLNVFGSNWSLCLGVVINSSVYPKKRRRNWGSDDGSFLLASFFLWANESGCISWGQPGWQVIMQQCLQQWRCLHSPFLLTDLSLNFTLWVFWYDRKHFSWWNHVLGYQCLPMRRDKLWNFQVRAKNS